MHLRRGPEASYVPPSGRNKRQRSAMRATQLMRKNQFARVAQLAGSLGIAECNDGTIKDIDPLFLEHGLVLESDLLAYYGPPSHLYKTYPPHW
jgi:hypothetical protein